MKLIEVCHVCQKPIQIRFQTKTHEFYKCGHGAPKDQPKVKLGTVDYCDLAGKDEAYDYQKIGYEFLRDSDFNGVIADGMGLGKTIQALMVLKNHSEDALPSLIIVKSATVGNWIREIHKWVSDKNEAVYPILGKQWFIPPGFQMYVISMDSLKTNEEGLKKFHEEIQPFKSVIVDECHSFKDDGSQRTKTLIKLLSGKVEKKKENIDKKVDTLQIKPGKHDYYVEGKRSFEYHYKHEEEYKPIKHRIFLSGTPILNKADEYFVTLNLLRPKEFSSRAAFRNRWLEQNDKKQWSRIKHWRRDEFQRLTNKFIIRREKTQVQKDLPSFRRDFIYVPVTDPEIAMLYNNELSLTENLLLQGKLSGTNLLGALARMRRITGMAKIEPAIEFANEFFENAAEDKKIDPEYPDKLAIGIHHVDVRNNLKLAFDARDETKTGINEDFKFRALTLSGEDSAWEKDKIVTKFGQPEHKLLIANELAGGVGLNLQMCANTLVLERQWNAAMEEQYESRFHRNGQTYPVLATYMIADKTIDAFFEDIVEKKRRIFGETISNWEFTQDNESMLELVKRAIDNPLR